MKNLYSFFNPNEMTVIEDLLRQEYDLMTKNISMSVVYGEKEKRRDFEFRRKICGYAIEKIEQARE